ncbi:hypothetical protein [Lentzea atacamensis]|uniref:hypothetical protein n=1 Tax=Lentzea atacamensis TaxID=531938 RepID=UPI001F26819F|nr:hypothetical protein [Lentzea atacamensis]
MRKLTWRPLTSEDTQSSADLLNVIETVDKIGENYTAEDTLTELIDPYADLERASLAAFDGDVMVGFMKAKVVHERNHQASKLVVDVLTRLRTGPLLRAHGAPAQRPAARCDPRRAADRAVVTRRRR